ncbi:galactoside 2-alpha-L-fucosyltransferase-like [Euphorbia lathyris]|uniref:galactoside 2-alpha-L-fucosyltransferase-like n=1 Tax=Euphorbia lathyris TaxID=212925 RepID=UPI00331429BD
MEISTNCNVSIIVTCLLIFPLLVMVSVNNQDQIFNLVEVAKVNVLGGKAEKFTQIGVVSEHDSDEIPDDVLLGGLLASGFDQESCFSRYQSVKYRKHSPPNPSAYLISKLRDYKNLHKKCEPHSEFYNRTVRLLDSRNVSGPAECNYIVWKAQEGLGNRILSMTSAFLYALLTNRVLLVEHNSDMFDLFCEPFPNTTWLLPPDFPDEFRWNSPRPTFGNLLKSNIIDASMKFPPSFLYIFIAARLDLFDTFFYCDEYHTSILPKVPWLILRSDKYFVPSLFLMPSFQEELDRMFPDKESVFHNLVRYLIHPANKPWGLITRFYQSYLADADERIGMQVRVFDPESVSFGRLMDQILACTLEQNLMPTLDKQKLIASPSTNKTSKAVLIASLYSHFYDNLTNTYLTFPTTSGDVIAVYQPSHENRQHFGDNKHNMKAWVEMNLLSLSNVLVTSSWSTFGYVSQGLGGLKPWILPKPEDWNTTSPACKRAMSMEPCLHRSPYYDCKTKANIDTGNIVPYVKHCEDATSGLKLVNNHD